MQSEIHSTLKQIANLDWATIYSKYQEKRYILSREDFIEEEIKYNFPNSYRLYQNWEVFALTQWKLIR